MRRRPSITRATALLAAGIVLAAVASAGVREAALRHRPELAVADMPAAAPADTVPGVDAGVPAAHVQASPRRRGQRLALPPVLPLGTLQLPILMYHRIDRPSAAAPAITQRLTVAPAEFAAEMQWLADHGYHTLSERQVYDATVRGRRLPSHPVVVTFDDGYRDVLRYAVPVLERLHQHATAFVITGRVSTDDALWLSWRDLRAMEAAGLDIGSHTVAHVDLTALPPAAALAQLEQSRQTLERHLGHPVQWFAYPFGGDDAAVTALARQAGYVLAMTTRPGRLQDRARPLELHRSEVLDSTGVQGVAALVGA